VEREEEKSIQHKDEGSIVHGMIVCWLLNVAHLGIAYLLFVHGERMLPTVFVLVGAIGLLQVGYIAPLWYFLRRQGKRRMARGMAIAAMITLVANATYLAVIYKNG
jgi:cation transport ATPase